MILRHPLTRNIGIGAPSHKGAGREPSSFIDMTVAQKSRNFASFPAATPYGMTNSPLVNRALGRALDLPSVESVA